VVVLLGEPGSGKTFELQYQATLSSVEQPRFYFRLDELGGEQYRLREDDAERLTQWQQGRTVAIFLLDSVDEAKIRQAADFYRALDRFVELIGRRRLGRARIVISSRITEWLPTVDGHEVRMRFPTQSPKQEESEKKEELYPFVVQLMPMDEDAVKTYAKARGVEDVDRFLEALGEAHAWELARRPADVNDLVAFWRESGGLGTLTEILDFVCDSQLRKTSDRDREELLTLEQARDGAECLAAATVLCGKFIFQIPGETNPAPHAIDALACLPPSWRNEEVRALLNHPLFDGASYGHIRFHHRRLSEFLAARWFERLMAKDCPIEELEGLLFDMRGSRWVLRPSLAPVAAWMCSGTSRWNERVCRHVIEVAPEILLRYGDPATLSVQTRRSLLKALLKKAEGRNHLWWESDRATLARLSNEALVPDINELLLNAACGSSLRELGLDIVSAGRLKECALVVLQTAIRDLREGAVFPTAVRALEAVADESHLRALADAAKEVDQFPERVCVPLCELLFPRIWSVSELFHVLDKLTPRARSGFGWDHTLSECFVAGTNKNTGLQLLTGLLGHPIDDGDEFDPPSNVRAALAVSSTMLDWPHLSDEEASMIAEVLVRIADRRSSLYREESIPEGTERHLKVRERYFRRAAERLASEHDVSEKDLSSILIFYNWIKPVRSDLDWILDWLKEAPLEKERERALSWALEAWNYTGRCRADLVKIKRAAKSFPPIRKILWRHFHPGLVVRVRVFWNRHIRYRSYRHRLRMTWWKVQQPLVKLRDTWNLWRYRKKLRSGEYEGWLAKLVSEAGRESRWAPEDWSSLEKTRGAKCAIAVKEGCLRVWERHEPPLPHQKQNPNETSWRTILGLAGLKSGWDDGKIDFARLSLVDARRATRYALDELNGFAHWFDDLARAHPEAVRSILLECISGEWEIPADAENHHLVLNDLAHSDSVARDLIKSELLARLTQNEPKNHHILRDALCILVAFPNPASAVLAALAKSRCGSVSVDGPSFSLWMIVWLQADALSALDELEAVLTTATHPDQVMISICANLNARSGYRLPLLQGPSWLEPKALRRFIPLIYRYIRREDDIDRPSGECYTPGARDNAQEFRNGLFERLIAAKNTEVGPVLEELLSEPLLDHLHDYMRHLIEKHRAEMAESPSWRASDVRRFAIEYERDPQTDTDLFRLGMRRLRDLKSWVENGEDSPRKEVHEEDLESGLRDWLRRRLNDSSRGFVVPPEWQIVGGRPDLRLVLPDAVPVSIEIKIADNWTLQQLVDGLETQLVGQYLRDDRARYGIYVLGLFDRDRKWDALEAGPRIGSEQVLNLLQNRSREILKARPDIAGLEVIMFCFAPPSVLPIG
jgi:hypothetical protein